MKALDVAETYQENAASADGVIQVVGMVESSAVEFYPFLTTISSFSWVNSFRSAVVVYILLGILFVFLPSAIILHWLVCKVVAVFRRKQAVNPSASAMITWPNNGGLCGESISGCVSKWRLE
jgi:hypothetical protein